MLATQVLFSVVSNNNSMFFITVQYICVIIFIICSQLYNQTEQVSITPISMSVLSTVNSLSGFSPKILNVRISYDMSLNM